MFLDHLALHMEKKIILLELLFHVFSQEGGKKREHMKIILPNFFFRTGSQFIITGEKTI